MTLTTTTSLICRTKYKQYCRLKLYIIVYFKNKKLSKI